MTEAEWVDVFSALMTGADLSYPDRSHQVVWNLLRNLEFPISMEQFAGYRDLYSYQFSVTTGTALVNTIDAAQWFNFFSGQTTPAINDALVGSVPEALQTGQYSFSYLYQKLSNSGIATIDIVHTDGTTVSVATVDEYAAATARNQVATGLFTLPKTGNWNLRKRMLSKNASSTGYNSRFTRLQIGRAN